MSLHHMIALDDPLSDDALPAVPFRPAVVRDEPRPRPLVVFEVDVDRPLRMHAEAYAADDAMAALRAIPPGAYLIPLNAGGLVVLREVPPRPDAPG